MFKLRKLAGQPFQKRSLRRILSFALVLFIAVCVFSQGEVLTANSLKQRQIIVTKGTNFVSDSFNGVNAIYRQGRSDGSSQTYSCAAFVKKYYKKIYKKNVYNLLYKRTPLVTGGKVNKVSKPQPGDIVGSNTNHGTTHWAIVKAVNSDNTVTLIEQNWKWQSGGRTYTVINRKIKTSSARFYRLDGVKAKIKKAEKLNSTQSVLASTSESKSEKTTKTASSIEVSDTAVNVPAVTN